MTKKEQHFPDQEVAQTCKLEYSINLCQIPAVQRGGWLMAGAHPGTSGAPVCGVCETSDEPSLRSVLWCSCVWLSGHEESTAAAWNHSTALARLVRLSWWWGPPGKWFVCCLQQFHTTTSHWHVFTDIGGGACLPSYHAQTVVKSPV